MKILRKCIISLSIITIFLPNVSFAKDIDKYSKSSILINQQTGRVLYEKDADTKRPFASVSKIMTFLLAVEAIENGRVKEDDIIKIDKDIAKINGSSYKLKAGEEVPLIELMKGLMIVSGNDAAVAIANHIGGNTENFVKMMNDKAKEIGLKSTNFVNPNGLPIYDINNEKALPKENISTAREIVLLCKYLLDNYEKQTIEITDMQTYTYDKRSFCKNNTNALLSIIPEVDGIKTGYTGNAGYCLAFSMKLNKDEKNEIDTRLIGVTLGANHKNKRLEASRNILNYGKNNFKTFKITEKDQLIGKKYIKGIEELEVILKTSNDFYQTLGLDEEIKTQVTLKELSYPIKKGDVLGVIKYYTQNGESLGDVEIISDNTIDKISFESRLKMIINNYK